MPVKITSKRFTNTPRSIQDTVTKHLPIPKSEGSHAGPRTIFRHQDLPYDLMANQEVELIVFLWSVQTGKTTVIFDGLIDHMCHGQGQAGWIMQSEEAIRDQIRNKYNEIIEASSDYIKSFIQPVNKNLWLTLESGINTNRGISCSINSAKAGDNLRSNTIALYVLDEFSLYPKTKDGTVYGTIRRGTVTVKNRQIWVASTPLTTTTDATIPLYETTNCAERQIHCPHCNEYHYPTWDAFDVDRVMYVCKLCNEDIDEKHAKATDEWVVTKEERGIKYYGLKMNAILSPLMSWERLVEEWYANTEAQFMRQYMVEAWDEVKIETPDYDIFDLAEWSLDDGPPPGVVNPVPKVTIGADLNDRHLDYVVLYHYDGGRIIYLAHRGAIAFTTDMSCFIQFEEEAMKWSINGEKPLICIDANWETDMVAQAADSVFREWSKREGKGNRFMATRGSAQPSFNKPDVLSRGRLTIWKYIYTIAVDALKYRFYTHDLESITDDERETTFWINPSIRKRHRRELVSEILEEDPTKKDGAQWVLKRGQENHSLDCVNNAMVAPACYRFDGNKW